MKKARLRLMRDARLNAALDTHVGEIQSSLESINVQLKSLSALSKGLERIDEFSKERLAARSRDNLRIEGLKKLYRLACGNLKFVSGIEVDECIYENLASIQRRISFLMNSIGKANGVTPESVGKSKK